jgi:hypothetical protein
VPHVRAQSTLLPPISINRLSKSSLLSSARRFIRTTAEQSKSTNHYRCIRHESKRIASMSDTAKEKETWPPAPNTKEGIASPTNIARHGHESIIPAQPSTFLLPRGHNRAMQDKPLTALDRDQMHGLVSGPLSS